MSRVAVTAWRVRAGEVPCLEAVPVCRAAMAGFPEGLAISRRTVGREGWERRVFERLAPRFRRAEAQLALERVFQAGDVCPGAAVLWVVGTLLRSSRPMAGDGTALVSLRVGEIAAKGEVSADGLARRRRPCRSGTAWCVAHQQPGRQPGAGRHDQRRDPPPARRSIPRCRVFAVVEDICASGGYGGGGDRIYFRDKASIVGSIGVLMDGLALLA